MNSSRWDGPRPAPGRHRSSGTYYSAEARQRIDGARHIVATHVELLGTDRCVVCGQLAPCGARVVADGTLRAYGQLPRRVPGATLSEAVLHTASVRTRPSLFDRAPEHVGRASGQHRYAPAQSHGMPNHRVTSNGQVFSWFTAGGRGDH